MIEGDRVNDTEVGQVVLVGHIVSVPGNHVVGGMILVSHEQLALVFGDNFVGWHFMVLVPGNWG